MTTILGIIAGAATIVGGFVYLFKRISWQVTPTPETKQQDIAVDNQKKEDDYRKTGIPQ